MVRCMNVVIDFSGNGHERGDDGNSEKSNSSDEETYMGLSSDDSSDDDIDSSDEGKFFNSSYRLIFG